MPIIATAGHVDHGKSSLVTAITGMATDRIPEEQRTGRTIELGFAHTTTAGGTTLSFIDVPGHIDFIRTMVSGVSGVDVVMLVVDAGEGWMPQTHEHLRIVEALGARSGVVAISRVDRVDATARERVHRQTRHHLAHSPIAWRGPIATSTIDGTGLADLAGTLATIVDAVPSAEDLGRPRLSVDRVFTITGRGTVVTGTVTDGTIDRSTHLAVVRTGTPLRIRGLHQHHASVTACRPGTRAALNLIGVAVTDIRRGDVLVEPGRWHITSRFDAHVTVFAEPQRNLTRRGAPLLHLGTATVAADIRIIGRDSIPPGESGLARLRITTPAPMRPGDRFVLSDAATGRTTASGIVVHVDPRGRIRDATGDGSLDGLLRERGAMQVAEARRLTGTDVEPTVGDWVVGSAALARLRQALTARIAAGPVDLALLSPIERAVAADLTGVVVEYGTARSTMHAPADDPVARHFLDAGITPPPIIQREATSVRRLDREGVLVAVEGTAFHRDVLVRTLPVLRALWRADPAGFTIAELRDALAITRRHAFPLAAALDRAGLTTRVGDRRVMGPMAIDGGGGRESNPPDGGHPSRPC